MLASLFAVIARTVALSEADQALCAQVFQPVAVPRNTVLEAAGAVPAHLYFIVDGYLRLYYQDERGDEATTALASGGEFLTPFLSFIHQRPATESLAAITACDVLRIAHPHLKQLIAASPAFQQFSLLIFEQAIAATAHRADSLATRAAGQRYRDLLAARPDLLLHVPVQYVASFLGIKPESLSRIRRQLIS